MVRAPCFGSVRWKGRRVDMNDHPRGRIAGWILLALAGLAIAVALSVTASNLSTQPIGLSGEPLRAGDRLAPASVKSQRTTTTRTSTTPTTTSTATMPTVTPTGTATTSTGTSTSAGTDDDHGGESHHDSDDD